MKQALLLIFFFFHHPAFSQRSEPSYIPVADSKVYVETSGRGPALVLLHAGNCDHRMWQAQVRAFSKHYRVILCDLRGCGSTQDGDSTYLQSDAILAVMDTLKIRQASFIGLSLGSVACLDFALSHPERVSKLVLASPGLIGIDLDRDSALHRYAKLVEEAGARHDTLALAEAFVQTWGDGPQRKPEEMNTAVRRQLKEMVYQNIAGRKKGVHLGFRYEPTQLQQLPSLKKQPLVIVGKQDVQDILLIADVFKKQGAKVVYISNAAHMVNMEHPDSFNREVLNFLVIGR